jgi:hypothetical protein
MIGISSARFTGLRRLSIMIYSLLSSRIAPELLYLFLKDHQPECPDYQALPLAGSNPNFSLFVSQCHQRIRLRRSASGQVTGQQRSGGQNERHARECRRVGRAHAK